MDGIRACALVMVICVVCCLCHPSRPLNERSPELAWQAWLLVDDQYPAGRQNGPGAGADATTLKRRITPKSVFIAPTFSPQDLPPCADGYASDPMGRCMKIFKLDEDEHLNFLLDKLKEKFGGGDLDYGDEEDEQDSGSDTPLQINIPFGSDELNSSNGDDETDMAIVVAPTNSNFTVQEFAESVAPSEISVRISTATDPPLETTTFFTASTSPDTELSTIPMAITTTTDAGEETTTEMISSTTIVPSTTEQLTTETISDDATTFTPPETTETATETSTTQTSATTTGKARVRFPDDNDLIGHQQTRDTSNRVRNFWPNFSNGPATTHHQQHPYPQPQLIRFPDTPRKISYRWSGSGGAANIHKPLVLRFSKKNSYLDANQFNRPDFYRALPSNDLSYIFGFKHRPAPQK